jgi:hypothetical protein
LCLDARARWQRRSCALLRRHHPWGRSPRRGLRLEAMNSKAPASMMGITLPPVDLCGHQQAGPHVSSNVAAANVLLHRHQTSPRRRGDERVAQSRGAQRRRGGHVREATEAGSFRIIGIRHCGSLFSRRTRSQRQMVIGPGAFGPRPCKPILVTMPIFLI